MSHLETKIVIWIIMQIVLSISRFLDIFVYSYFVRSLLGHQSVPWIWKWLKQCLLALALALQCWCNQAYLFLCISSFIDSLEVKEHLRPPTDSEEHSDHWERRRKLFKESKQRSSAGGFSLTSNITEESGIHLHICSTHVPCVDSLIGFKGRIDWYPRFLAHVWYLY